MWLKYKHLPSVLLFKNTKHLYLMLILLYFIFKHIWNVPDKFIISTPKSDLSQQNQVRLKQEIFEEENTTSL